MSFFPNPSAPPPEPEHSEWTPPVWFRPPRDELPVTVPLDRVLHGDPHLVVWLPRAEAYSDGVSFMLRWRMRRRAEQTPREWDDLVNSVMRIGPFGSADPGEGFRFGLRLADGALLSNENRGSIDVEATPERALTPHDQGGGGDTSSYEGGWDLWAWPALPRGPLALGVSCGAIGLPETVLDFPDTEPFRVAAPRPLWG
ncbi:MAG: hypothetical protein JWP66_355 [Naasia sp.]|nr:hypothetical protein [Naasia sp.]